MDIEVDEYNGRCVNAKGGSELMYDALLQRLPAELADPFQFIVSRVRRFIPGKKAILWCQDPWTDAEARHLSDAQLRRRFSKIVFASQYQFHAYHHEFGVPYSESVVLPNAIEPICRALPARPTDSIRLIYHSVPHRGLRLLLPVFVALAQRWPKLHLDVYSSLGLYGRGDLDYHFERLFAICREHPQITYHGSASNEEVRETLKHVHIHAYPCTVLETCPVAVMEAMSAGCLVVCPDVAGIQEIVSRSGVMYRWTENDQDHERRFAAALESAIEMIDRGTATPFQLSAQERISVHYNWDTRIGEWTRMLAGILEEERVRVEPLTPEPQGRSGHAGMQPTPGNAASHSVCDNSRLV